MVPIPSLWFDVAMNQSGGISFLKSAPITVISAMLSQAYLAKFESFIVQLPTTRLLHSRLFKVNRIIDRLSPYLMPGARPLKVPSM